MKPQAIIKSTALGYSLIRSIHFTAQGALLPLVDKISGLKTDRSFKQFKEHLRMAFPKAQKILAKEFTLSVF